MAEVLPVTPGHKRIPPLLGHTFHDATLYLLLPAEIPHGRRYRTDQEAAASLRSLSSRLCRGGPAARMFPSLDPASHSSQNQSLPATGL